MDLDSKKPTYVTTATEILELKVTKTPMLIENLLPEKGTGSLSGSSDGGKSFLGLFLACAICGDQDNVLGLQINRLNNSAIIVCTEDSAEDICVRLTGFLKNLTVAGKNLRFIFETDNLEEKLHKELTRQPADLVILDTFGDLYSGNLNDSIAIRKFLRPYKQLANDFSCLFLFNHHIGKGKEHNASPSKNDVLGSQGIESACRTVLMLRKHTDGTRVLTVVKGNHIPDKFKDKGIVLKFDVELGFEATGQAISYTDVADENRQALEQEVLTLYPKLKSYAKVAKELRNRGHKKIDKNRVGDIWKKHHPSVRSPKQNDGRIGKEPETDDTNAKLKNIDAPIPFEEQPDMDLKP